MRALGLAALLLSGALVMAAPAPQPSPAQRHLGAAATAGALTFAMSQYNGPGGLQPLVSSVDPCPAMLGTDPRIRVSWIGLPVSIFYREWPIHADGSWTANTGPANDTPFGSYTVRAECVTTLFGSDVINATYTDRTFVVDQLPPNPSVGSNRVTVGQSLFVSSGAHPCPSGGPDTKVIIALQQDSLMDFHFLGLLDSDAAGHWSGTLAVIDTITYGPVNPGSYYVIARCHDPAHEDAFPSYPTQVYGYETRVMVSRLTPLPRRTNPPAPTGPTAPRLNPITCADVLFLGARGSGQAGPGTPGWTSTAADPLGLGNVVLSAYNTVAPRLNGHRSIATISVDYPAGGALGAVFDPVDYFNGIGDGVNFANNTLRQRAAACPRERIVLAGYSQGAMVMHRVLRLLWNSGSGTQILHRIDGAVLVGDGDRVPNDITLHYGSMHPGFHGIGLDWTSQSGSSTAAFAPELGVRVSEVCNGGDFVCDQPAALIGIGIHLAYSGSQVLADAAADVAREVMSNPLPRPAEVQVTAVAGIAVSYQLKADVDPNYQLQWSILIPAIMPAGLTLDGTGLVSGTPVGTPSGTTPIRVRGVILGVAGDWIDATIVWNAPSRR